MASPKKKSSKIKEIIFLKKLEDQKKKIITGLISFWWKHVLILMIDVLQEVRGSDLML